MKNTDIKYSDIQTLMSEYRNKIGKNLQQLSALMNDINALAGDKVDFAGQGAGNIRNYYAQVHLTLLTGMMEVMQAMLAEVAVYKDGYDRIDGSENFHYNESASEDLHKELEFQSSGMNTYHQKVREELLNIADLFEGYEPSNESVQFNISETLGEMDIISEEVGSHENNTKKRLNDIKEVLVRLMSMIADANAYGTNIEEYDGSPPFKPEDIIAFYEGYKKLDLRISETGHIMEKVFREEDKRLAAKQRENQGLLEMAEAAMLIVVGGALCVASAGAATPLVAVGFSTLGTVTAAYGIADAVEGTQDFYYGAGEDGTRSVNPLKDTLFIGNDDLYNMCESVTVSAASLSLPVAATGTATAKGFARLAFEYGVSGLAGQGSSYLAYKATGDKNIANIANVVGATVAGGLAGKNTQRRNKVKFRGNIEERFRKRVSESGLNSVDISKYTELSKAEVVDILKTRGLDERAINDLIDSFDGPIYKRIGYEEEIFTITESKVGDASGVFVTRGSAGSTPMERINNLALPPNNAALVESKVKLARTQILLEGKVASQQEWALIANDGIPRTGGAWQVVTDGGKYSNAIRR